MQVYYNGEGFILIELHGAALELSRAEAEQLFVDLGHTLQDICLLYTSPSPRDRTRSRMPSSA